MLDRRRALLAAPGKTSPRAERGLLAQQLLQMLSTGRSHEEVRSLAQRLLAGEALVEEEGADSLNVWIAVGALSWSDDFEPAEAAIEAALADTARRGDYLTGALALYTRAWPRFWSGRIAEALADAQAAVSAWRGTWAMYLPGAMYWLARAHVERDELDEAEAALDLPDAEVRWAGTTMYAAWRAARGRVALARGHAEEALAEQLASGALLRDTLHLPNPAIVPWASRAALAAARLGRRDPQARALAGDELDAARDASARRAPSASPCARPGSSRGRPGRRSVARVRRRRSMPRRRSSSARVRWPTWARRFAEAGRCA